MYKTVVKVDGMMCGMCESHVNEAVKKAIDDTGYKVLSIETQPYEKKKFSLFGRK